MTPTYRLVKWLLIYCSKINEFNLCSYLREAAAAGESLPSCTQS